MSLQWQWLSAHHCHTWWSWWSDTLWATLIRSWLHSLSCYLQDVVENYLQFHNFFLFGFLVFVARSCFMGWTFFCSVPLFPLVGSWFEPAFVAPGIASKFSRPIVIDHWCKSLSKFSRSAITLFQVGCLLLLKGLLILGSVSKIYHCRLTDCQSFMRCARAWTLLVASSFLPLSR